MWSSYVPNSILIIPLMWTCNLLKSIDLLNLQLKGGVYILGFVIVGYNEFGDFIVNIIYVKLMEN